MKNLVESNYLNWIKLKATLPGHTLHETEYATWITSTRPAGVNAVEGCWFDEKEYPEQIDTILKTYQDANLYANWSFGPSATPKGLRQYLRNVRRLLGPRFLPAMVLDLSNLTLRQLRHEVSEVSDWDSIREEGHPKSLWLPKTQRSDGFEMSRELDAKPNVISLVTRVNGNLASCVTVFIDGEVAGIYDVVTKEEYRNQGAARDALQRGLEMAKDRGCRVATLQSYPKATELYEKLGFRTEFRYVTMYYSRVRMEADRKERTEKN